MQHPVRDRREDDPHHSDEHESAEERVARGEDFSAGVGERVHRSHAAEDHGCV